MSASSCRRSVEVWRMTFSFELICRCDNCSVPAKANTRGINLSAVATVVIADVGESG